LSLKFVKWFRARTDQEWLAQTKQWQWLTVIACKLLPVNFYLNILCYLISPEQGTGTERMPQT
jgi:hypothetical protein